MEPKLTVRELNGIIKTLEKVTEDLSDHIKNWEAVLSGEIEVENKASDDQLREWIKEDAESVSNLLKVRSLFLNTVIRITTEA